MTIEIKAPAAFNKRGKLAVFLAGSIEMGAAEMWQDRIVKAIDHPDIMFLNPRRDDWDWTWEQKIDNPKFREQVDWEHNAMELADVILFYFVPDTKSPISLMELGMWAYTDKPVVVCCPEGFWRKGNVDITCDRTGIRVYDNLETFIESLPKSLEFALEMKKYNQSNGNEAS